MVNHLLQLFLNCGPNATYEFVPISFVRDNSDDSSQDLAFWNISPRPTQVSQTARKPDSTSDEQEMPHWLCEIANILEETAPTVPNVSKLDKDKRRKIRNRVKAQQGPNVVQKIKKLI